MERHKAEYPNINGFPVSPYELPLPNSVLDLNEQKNWNNHHACFYKRKMGELVITQTWRDLESNQYVVPIDTHNFLHHLYEPSPLPRISDIMDVLYDAYQSDKPLKYGSANNPRFDLINDELWHQIDAEYNRINRLKAS